MKNNQHCVFYKSVTALSLLLAVFSTVSAQAAPAKPVPAKQIGFKVIDQPAVVIEGNSNQNQSAFPSMAAEPVVEGFADKVPLSVAVQQILPQGYGYTLGDGVDAGQLVSWRGGRPWNDVLQNMLGSSGLSYSVNGRSVAINGVGIAPTIVTGIPPLQPVQPPVQMIQQPMPDQQMMVMQQQPVMMDMQPQPQLVQQPMMMPPPMPDQQMVMMQPQPIMQAPVQQQVPISANAGSSQPLHIENPLLYVPQVWEVRPGKNLRALLQEWCNRVGTELSWTAEFDYPVMASLNINGTFEEAVRTVLSGFDGAKPTPRGRLHYNPAAGQSILIVEANGNNYGD